MLGLAPPNQAELNQHVDDATLVASILHSFLEYLRGNFSGFTTSIDKSLQGFIISHGQWRRTRLWVSRFRMRGSRAFGSSFIKRVLSGINHGNFVTPVSKKVRDLCRWVATSREKNGTVSEIRRFRAHKNRTRLFCAPNFFPRRESLRDHKALIFKALGRQPRWQSESRYGTKFYRFPQDTAQRGAPPAPAKERRRWIVTKPQLEAKLQAYCMAKPVNTLKKRSPG